MNGRVGLVVTARLRSSRLPQKMLLDICGRPALWYPLTRMRRPTSPHVRIVCTTSSIEDDRIAEYAAGLGWETFRGDDEDVLARYAAACDHYGLDLLVNVDGDDLFCDDASVDPLVERYRATGADLIRWEGLPFGGAPTAIRSEAVRDVVAWKRERMSQGWAKYFVDSGRYRVETLNAPDGVRRPSYRLTLDYQEDLVFFRQLVGQLPAPDTGLREIVALLDQDPALVAVAAQVSDRYWERFEREHGTFERPA